jgi:serine/threonine-protein kinase HipA
MKAGCKGCFKPDIAEYCADCRAALFRKARVSCYLPFSVPERDQFDVLSSYGKDRKLRDIRLEIALQQNEDVLEPAEQRGSHILKVIPTGSFQRLEQLPANEHLTMQLAAQVYNIYIAPSAMAYLADESPSYLTRRIDISESQQYIEKYTLTELFAKHGELSFSTLADIAALLKKYLAAYKPQIEYFFSLCIFNHLFSCRGQALHQFSLVRTAEGEYVLSPAYNLLCTELHGYSDEDVLYHMPDGGPFLREGGYTYFDLRTFGTDIGIVPKRVDRILNRFLENEMVVEYMIANSFLSEESRGVYLGLYRDRLERLKRR